MDRRFSCQGPRRVGATAVLAFVLVWIGLAVPVSAPAAVTLGSDLSTGGSATSCPFGDCTVVQTSLPGRQVASPIDGVVVRARVRNANSTAPVRFRIVRPAAAGAFTGVASAETPGYACTAICTVSLRLPIAAGDHVGVDGASGSTIGTRSTPGAAMAIWSPFLADGETRAATASIGDLELLMNADVEPDADEDGYGDESQDDCPSSAETQLPCGKATLGSLARSVKINLRTGRGTGKARCTNVAGDVCTVRLRLRAPEESSAAQKRTVTVGTVKGTVKGGETGTLRFRLSKNGLARLREVRRLRVRAVGASRNRVGDSTKVKKRLVLRARR
jgi:hypothetical protein